MDVNLIERMFRRIQMLFGRGRVTLVDDSGTVQLMQVKMSDLEIPDKRIRMAEFGFTSNPPVDSDALALHIAGDRSAGAVIATNHQPSRPKNLAPGESMLYSEDGKQVYMTASDGIVVDAKGQNVVVNNAANVSWNCSGDFNLVLGGKFNVVAPGGTTFTSPLVQASGDIQDQAGTNTKTVAIMRSEYDEHGHPVVEVQSGDSTIISGTPTVIE